AGVRADSKALADESYQLLVDDRRVVIRGGSPRGQLYGVYSFLERLGCRWFTPKVSRIPRRLTLKLEGLDIVERPAFEYREIFCLEAFNGTWSARNRLNGNQHRMAARQGGGLRFGRAGVHTLHSLLPPEELFAEHPEFFPLIGKARSYRKAQICLSSTRARTVAAEQLKTWIREQPEAKYFSVSQMDWGGTCQCAPCIQADKEESRGLPYRAWSGGFLRFANEMASRIEKDFPDRFVTTLAYGLTEAPPAKVRPAKNVRVRFCAIRACQVHPWEKCTLPATTDTLKNLKAWTAMSKQLYVWHYGISFGHYLMPFPNLSAVGPQMQLCKRLGIRGVMWQTGDSRSIGADIAPLRAYVLARLLWNPDIPVRETIKEFVDGVYGAAAEPVLEYLDEIHRPFESAEHHLTCSPRVPAPFFGDEALRKCRQHLLEAREAAKGNRRLLLAIRRLELGVDYLSLWNEKALLPPKEKTSRLPHISPATSGEQLGKIRDFIRSCRGLKIARLGESLTLSELSKTIPFAATTVTPTHPFLLINRHEISDLRKKVEHEPWRSVFAKIIFAANRGRASRSYYETALAYAVTEKPRYLSKIRAALLHAADAFKGQSSEKRLSVATYHEGPRFGNAEFAYDIIHDALTREERERVEAWLRQACEEALIHLATARTNPNMKAVAACEIGRKGCVIGEGRFVEWAKEEFKARIDRLRDTGFWREPPTYVYNVLASLTALAEAVLRYDGTDLYRYRSPGGHTLKSLLDSEIRVAYPIE
ncbi:MAG: DUF4838 domain-containing protein, partial [Planctomycetota bacterium]|nr:DUF4838 domain-containing protein [Planctomycetota bacterium]